MYVPQSRFGVKNARVVKTVGEKETPLVEKETPLGEKATKVGEKVNFVGEQKIHRPTASATGLELLQILAWEEATEEGSMSSTCGCGAMGGCSLARSLWQKLSRGLVNV